MHSISASLIAPRKADVFLFAFSSVFGPAPAALGEDDERHMESDDILRQAECQEAGAQNGEINQF
ncbi:hypothetical protein ACFLX9_04200 [Chloroflexota bacterium]